VIARLVFSFLCTGLERPHCTTHSTPWPLPSRRYLSCLEEVAGLRQELGAARAELAQQAASPLTGGPGLGWGQGKHLTNRVCPEERAAQLGEGLCAGRAGGVQVCVVLSSPSPQPAVRKSVLPQEGVDGQWSGHVCVLLCGCLHVPGTRGP